MKMVCFCEKAHFRCSIYTTPKKKVVVFGFLIFSKKRKKRTFVTRYQP